MSYFKKYIILGASLFVSALLSQTINAQTVTSTTAKTHAVTPTAGTVVRTQGTVAKTRNVQYVPVTSRVTTQRVTQHGVPYNQGYKYGYTHGHRHGATYLGAGYVTHVGYHHRCRTKCWINRYGHRRCRRVCGY